MSQAGTVPAAVTHLQPKHGDYSNNTSLTVATQTFRMDLEFHSWNCMWNQEILHSIAWKYMRY